MLVCLALKAASGAAEGRCTEARKCKMLGQVLSCSKGLFD